MFGIKLKVLKRSGTFYDLNEATTSTPSLNGVIRGQPVFIAIFGIKFKDLMRTLRKYDLIDITKWVILTLTPIGVTRCQF